MSPDDEWERLLAAQRHLQQAFPDLVLVGGTAAALHAGHRRSLDGDHVARDRRHQYQGVLAHLEEMAGWQTNRLQPPVLILGNFEGVETGIRQLRRSAPLETEVIAGITVPTLGEMIRVKAWLVVTRNAVRDFVDLCALGARRRVRPGDGARARPPDGNLLRPGPGCRPRARDRPVRS